MVLLRRGLLFSLHCPHSYLVGLPLHIVISMITRLYNSLGGLIKSPLQLYDVESGQSGTSAGGERCSEQRLVYYYERLAYVAAYYIVYDRA